LPNRRCSYMKWAVTLPESARPTPDLLQARAVPLLLSDLYKNASMDRRSTVPFRLSHDTPRTNHKYPYPCVAARHPLHEAVALIRRDDENHLLPPVTSRGDRLVDCVVRAQLR